MGQTEVFTYDSLGRRSTQTDFRGIVTQYAYDAADRLHTIDYPSQTDVTLSYTPSGQLAQVLDANGTTRYAYDVRDRLSKVTYPDNTFVDYTYNAAGQRIRLGTPNQQIAYGYDPLDRLSAVALHGDASALVRYTYDAVGNRTSLTLPNGTRTQYTYNRQNRLTGILHKAGASLLLGLSYQLDPSGVRTQIDEVAPTGTRTSVYTYDAVKRLTAESVIDAVAGGRSASWTYDAVGNRLTQIRANQASTQSTTSVYDANDRLQTATTNGDATTYTYDDAGNTTRQQSNTATTNYQYDDANHLVQLTTLAAAPRSTPGA